MTVTDRYHLGLYDENFQIWEGVAPKTTWKRPTGVTGTSFCHPISLASPFQKVSAPRRGGTYLLGDCHHVAGGYLVGTPRHLPNWDIYVPYMGR